jgi:hypothetical protein
LEHCRAVRLAFPHKYSLAEFVKEFQSLLPEEVEIKLKIKLKYNFIYFFI